MARVVGDISVRVGADVSPLQRDMRRAGQATDGFQDRAREMSVNVAKAGAVVVTAMAGIATGVLAAAKEASSAATEIRNLANIAGTGTTEFQKMAAASKTVGIEQDKLSDIFKDVNDKFGDFIATGAGPLADFFENIAPKVGVTADQFARLSGPEALQLYVTSLEKAGVSQQQMTFYMEALASDATGLVPLLSDAGAEMRRLGDAAEDAGRILDEDMIAGAAELDQKLDELTDTLRMSATKAVLEHQEQLIQIVSFITESVLPALSGLTSGLATVATGWATIADAAQRAITPIAQALDLMDTPVGPGATYSPENQAVIDADIANANSMGGGDTSSTGMGYVDENGNWVEYGTGAATPEVPGITRGERVYSGRGAAAGPTPEEALEAAITARREANEQVEEEEERHAGRVKEIKEESVEDLAELEAAAQRARLQNIGGALGDLSSLMRTENDKLFKVGQAAAIAQATVSGYQAAVDAWQKGMAIGGPPVAAVFSGASLVKTGVLISKIKNASASGGGGGGGVGGAVNGALGGGGGGSSPLEVTLSGVSPDELISGANVSALFERLSEEAGDRGFTFVGQS